MLSAESALKAHLTVWLDLKKSKVERRYGPAGSHFSSALHCPGGRKRIANCGCRLGNAIRSLPAMHHRSAGACNSGWPDSSFLVFVYWSDYVLHTFIQHHFAGGQQSARQKKCATIHPLSFVGWNCALSLPITIRQLILRGVQVPSSGKAEKWRNIHSAAERKPHATTVWAIRYIDRTQPVTTKKMMMMTKAPQKWRRKRNRVSQSERRRRLKPIHLSWLPFFSK